MGYIKNLIEKNVPGIYVRSLQIGNNMAEVSYSFICLFVWLFHLMMHSLHWLCIYLVVVVIIFI